MTYEVTGTAPSGVIGPNITYGPSGSSFDGTVPMNITSTIPAEPPAYYVINIQLSDAGGNASCALKVNGHVISQGSTSGAHNIASCEIIQNPITGAWESVTG